MNRHRHSPEQAAGPENGTPSQESGQRSHVTGGPISGGQATVAITEVLDESSDGQSGPDNE
jgi:hypothetical protein